MKELSLLPDDLRRTPSVQLLDDWYQQSFLEMINFESSDPSDSSTIDNFTENLDLIRVRHSNVVGMWFASFLDIELSCYINTGAEKLLQFVLILQRPWPRE